MSPSAWWPWRRWPPAVPAWSPTPEAGLRFRARDPDALAEMAIRVLDDESLGQRLVSEGLQHIRRFDWADVAEQTAAVYRGLAREASPAQR